MSEDLFPAPEGDGEESHDQTQFAIDGNNTTSWDTEIYRDGFAGVHKDGVGLYVNAGGGNPGTHRAQVGHRNYGFYVPGQSWITITGFSVRRCESRSIQLTNAANVTVSRNVLSFSGHFGMQAEAVEKMKSGFPMIMYNVPGRTGVNMTAATTLTIAAEVPNVVGVKEASGNMEQILTILRDRPSDFVVLSGDDAWTLPLIGAGADGIISVASNEVPGLMSSMTAAALAGDFAGARRIHERLLPLMAGNFMESSPIPVKTACKMLGLIPTDTVRPPLAPITEDNRKKLNEILEQCGLFERASR